MVVAGDFVHVSNGAVGRIARIASVTASTIVLDGTATVGSGVGATLANVGGALAGPAGATGFPIGTMTNAVTNTTGNPVRVNLKNDQTYSITTGVTSSQGGVTFEGYTSAYGDQGMFTLDGGTSTIVLLTVSSGTFLRNAKIQNNGTSGTNAGINHTGGNLYCFRVVVNTVRGDGITTTVAAGANCVLDECEFYACNSASTAASGGVRHINAGMLVVKNCTIHDNTLTGVATSISGGFVDISKTIFDTNSSDGVLIGNTEMVTLDGCDFYNNGRDGIETTNTSGIVIARNCNFIKNGRFGVEQVASAIRNSFLYNCGYGSGTQVNVSGATSGTAIQEIGAVTYAADVTPWIDPANGDFRIGLSAAKNAGRGAFTETAASYAGTVGYPDIGAAQHQDIGDKSLIVSPTSSY